MMNSIDDLTFEEIRDNFLSGKYKYNTDESVDASRALHNKLIVIEDLIPLLTSKDHAAQSAGVYIASLEGEGAQPIFPYILAFIESPRRFIRDDVCDCFPECASQGHEFITLFERFGDSEQSIRVKVIQVLMCLADEQIVVVSEFLKGKANLGDLKTGISLLLEQINGDLTYKSLENNILTGGKIVRNFAYVAAFKKLGNTEKLKTLVQLSNEPDIAWHYEIYFDDE